MKLTKFSAPSKPATVQPQRRRLVVTNVSTPLRPQTTASTPIVSDLARKGAFSDVEKDFCPETSVSVEGSVPAWLQGSFIRNGPGVMKPFKHLFDGYSLLFKARFENGKVFVSHKFLESKAYQAYKKEGKPMWREFATPAADTNIMSEIFKTIGGALGFFSNITDNASVNVLPYGNGKAMAVTEAVVGTYLFDSKTLDTVSQVKYSDSVKGDLTTAHPGRDGQGNFVNICTEIGGGITVYSQKPGTMERQAIAKIPHRYPNAPAWMHSFPCSTQHALIAETPMYFSLESLITAKDTKYVFMDWKPEEGSRLHLVATSGPHKGRVCTFTAPAYFTFHQVNAYEDEERGVFVVDFSWYSDPEIVPALSMANVTRPVDQTGTIPPSALRRLEIPLAPLRAGKTEGGSIAGPRELVSAASLGNFFEFPTINPLYYGKKNRYTWAVCARMPTNVGNTLCKVDIETGDVKKWFMEGGIPGEPIFVPRPGATEEDDGSLIVVVTAADGKTRVCVIDARTMETQATTPLGYSVPYGFHAGWITQ